MPKLSQVLQKSRPKVIVAIPCFNSKPYIGDIVLKANKYVDQVIVIDYQPGA